MLTAIELARNARIAANRAYLGALLGPAAALVTPLGPSRAQRQGSGAEEGPLAGPPEAPPTAGQAGRPPAGRPAAPFLAADDPLVLVAARELARKAALTEATSQVRSGRLAHATHKALQPCPSQGCERSALHYDLFYLFECGSATGPSACFA